jgi:uncharacterized protein YlzI (FlbEa/FlbD family)
MAYNRQPQSVLAGTALKQNPPPNILQPAGIVPVTLDADIATTISLGVIQVGSGLSITPLGVLSATGSGSSNVSVKLTAVNYTALVTDYYIGAIKKDITITLPLSVSGKIYIVKNQVEGSIKVKGTGQNLDNAGDKTLGSEKSLFVVSDGTRWNIID